MKVISIITDYDVFDRIINHLKLTFIAEKPPQPFIFKQIGLLAFEAKVDYL
jgi:hypothetical protein